MTIVDLTSNNWKSRKLVDVKTEVRRYKLDGTHDGVMEMPCIGNVEGFRGDSEDPESFFVFKSFNTPGTVYRYDVASNTARVWSEAKVAINLDRIAVEQRFYKSKDGTRVPLFAAALPQVGVMDMLRFDRFTGGKTWVDEYGDPIAARRIDDCEQFKNTRSKYA